jgi:nucleoside-diphosphate-sugar epimerase
VISINALIGLLEELVGKKAVIEHLPPNPADMLANQADVSKARRLLGWEPRVGLTEGVQTLVDWYNAERSWARQVVRP